MANRYVHFWKQDEPMHRIHNEKFGSIHFNDSGLGDARFSPLVNPEGAILPTLYGAGTFRAAAMETIFHDLPDDLGHYIFPFRQLQTMVHSVILPARDLMLLDLGSVGLRSLKLKKTDIIETSPSMYPQTRKRALAWHEEFDDIDGLYWMSRQDDHAPACMLFGDRVVADDLVIDSPGHSLQAPPQLAAILDLARILGITQGRHFTSGIVGF